jgi:hypothetical protein
VVPYNFVSEAPTVGATIAIRDPEHIRIGREMQKLGHINKETIRYNGQSPPPTSPCGLIIRREEVTIYVIFIGGSEIINRSQIFTTRSLTITIKSQIFQLVPRSLQIYPYTHL